MTDPNNIDLGETLRIASQDQFWAIRGHAVQSYASLEQSLCNLFAIASGTSNETAGLILFRIGAGVRNAILDKLLQRKFQPNYNRFRNSLIKDLRPIDLERNEIVHWNAVNNVSGQNADGTPAVAVTLRPPTFAFNVDNSPEKDTHALLRFMEKCSFYARLINMFLLVISETSVHMPVESKKQWNAVFEEAIEYSPPARHPLSLRSGS